MKKGKVKGRKPKTLDIAKSQETLDYDKHPPIFSLERVQAGNYCFSKLDDENKASFAEAMFRRKTMTWSDIIRSDRHGLGTEKISRAAIKAPTDSVAHGDFLALRYKGKNPVVGYRQKNIFFVLWFDHNFSLYDHG